MEIRALNLAISQQEIYNALKTAFAEVKDFALTIDDSGITISGQYPFWVPVPFSTLWVPTVADGNLILTFEVLKVIGINVSDFRGALLKAIANTNQPAIAIGANDTVAILVPQLLSQIKQVKLSFTLQLASTQAGVLILVGGVI